MLPPDPKTEVTFRLERYRALFTGILETASNTFLLLIAVRWFEAGPTAKGFIAAGSSVGFLLSPLVVNLVERAGWRTSQAAGFLSGIGALAYFGMSAIGILPVFIVFSLIAVASLTSAIPLLTQMYQENYPARSRGRLFSRTVMIKIFVAALFSHLVGKALTGRIEMFPLLLIVFGISAAMSMLLLFRCPTGAITRGQSSAVFRGLSFVQSDRIFRQTLICWMLMGFANLMMFPLRVEYVANPRYGLDLSLSEVAFAVSVVPNVARLLLSPLWGMLFDLMNFFVLRVAVNLGFAIGILAFFTSDSYTGLILGSIIFGISNAGGEIAWSLWVTKFAPPERVADYMAAHSFLTGVRGVIAPFVAFHAAQHYSLNSIAIFCALLICLASAVLVPEFWAGAKKDEDPVITAAAEAARD